MKKNEKIIITGGEGRLARILKKPNKNLKFSTQIKDL